MKLVILGTSGGFSGKNDCCSSYLISCNGKNLIVDLGSGAVSHLQNHIHYTAIDCIFLSHLHADHVSDLYTLRYAFFRAQQSGQMKKPVPLYMPRRPRKPYRFLRSSIKEEFSIHHITERLVLDIEDIGVSFLRTRHGIQAYAMKFAYAGKTLVYTSDTMYFDKLLDFCAGAHILLSEASLQNREKDMEKLGHMTAASAGKLAKNAGVQKLLLTHIWPEDDRSVSLEEAKPYFNNVEIARPGQELVI